MGKNDKRLVEIIFVLGNMIIFAGLSYLFFLGHMIFELYVALLFLIILADTFLGFMYFLHKKMKNVAKSLGFTFLTRFLEQPRMEGIYNKNWFQLHFTSRSYSEYWGMPRTYIKLQFKEDRNYDDSKLKKAENAKVGNQTIKNIEHVKRPYKNYLLMRVDWYVTDLKILKKLMDMLIRIEKEAKLK